MAYRFSGQVAIVEWLVIDFYQVGVHENFYEALKRYLRNETN